MQKTINTTNAPAAVGPYSQAVLIENLGLIYTAGQIGLVPSTGEMVVGGVEAQTRQVLQNLQAVLEAAGSGLAEVIKTTVFLADMADFQKMNMVYQEFFPVLHPARSAVAVKELPKKALVEIEAIALLATQY